MREKRTAAEEVGAIEVDFNNLALAEQVLERQGDHSRAVKQHLRQYATLDAGDMGLILQMLLPINDALLDVADQALDLSARVFDEGASRMGQTRESYVSAEREAHDRIGAVARQLGLNPSPYAPPASPTLGAPLNGAPSRYGEPDGNLFNQAFWDGYSAGEWAQETGSRAGDRVRDGLSGPRDVTEACDVRSFLVTPHADDPEIENIRWSAGVIFGGVDWIFEKLFGYSLLEEITKPFTGNWTRMKEGAFAWTHTSDALNGLSQNAAGLLPSMASWTGKGSEAFLVAATATSQAHGVLSGPAGTVSTMLKGLAIAAKEAAKLILKILRKIQDRLLILAAEAAIPIAGWVAAAVTAGISLVDLTQDVLKAYKYVNIVYDVVSGMVSGISNLSDSAFRMADLAEGLARGAAARV
ncbi:hypothetical protein ACFVTX_03035 [Agromyces sp. NPDC058136]|uniref:hypothetical protein n=1 Tax=Agromyces sp. NPDC058136 TaxID=3346354 RepID=UPI0036DB2F18